MMKFLELRVEERDDFSVHLSFTSILTSLIIPRRGKGRPAEVVLVTRGGKLEDFSITWFCDRALISRRKIQDMFIHPLKEVQMIKLGKSVMAALVISVLIAGLLCCQRKEGPVGPAG